MILTTYDLDEYVFDALSAGASRFLLKDVPPEELIYGVRIVARGDALLAPRVTRRLVSEFARRRHKASQPSFSTDLLTAREMEVLGFIARASSNGEIAQALYVRENTVKSDVTHPAR